jgi:hypothetical protein
VARIGFAKTSQPLAPQRQYPPLEFGIFFNPVSEVALEPPNGILPAYAVSDVERIAKISIFAPTGAANVNVKGFLFDIHNYRLHCSSSFSWLVGDKCRLSTQLIFPSPFR